jgi:hypothetical protein
LRRKGDAVERIEAQFFALLGAGGGPGWERRQRQVADGDRVVQVLHRACAAVVALEDRVLGFLAARGAEREFMLHAAGREGAEQFGAKQVRGLLQALVVAGDAAGAGAHVVVAETRKPAVALGFGVAGFHGQRPVVAERVVGAQLGVGDLGIEHGPWRPQQFVGVREGGQRDHAVDGRQPGDASLLRDALAVVLDVGLEGEPAVDAPVERRRHEPAVAVHVVDVGADAPTGCVDAHAVLLLVAELAPEVDQRLRRAAVVDREAHGAHGRTAGALGHEVDDAGRCGEAVVERRCALQHLHALLVLHGNLGDVGNRERAVEPVVRPVLDRDAADHELVEGVAAILLARHAGRVAQRLVDAGRALELQHVARDGVDRRGHVHDVGAAECAGFHGVGDEPAGRAGLDRDGVELPAHAGGVGGCGVGGTGDLRVSKGSRECERRCQKKLVHRKGKGGRCAGRRALQPGKNRSDGAAILPMHLRIILKPEIRTREKSRQLAASGNSSALNTV